MSTVQHEIDAMKHEIAELRKEVAALRRYDKQVERDDDTETRIAIILAAHQPLREWYESIGLDHVTMTQKAHAYLKSLAWTKEWRDYCDNRLVGTNFEVNFEVIRQQA